MIKLSDTQRVLLSSASQRETGSILPLPGTLASAGGRIGKSIAALLTRGLVEERETSVGEAVHRSDGDNRFGLFLTKAGAAAIGVGEDDGQSVDKRGDGESGEGAGSPEPVPGSAPKATTKSAAVLALLQRPEGATLPDIIAATGWLPHTTRAALTGLRKKGHAIERTKRDDATSYHIAGAR